jgi:hypothetical protein
MLIQFKPEGQTVVVSGGRRTLGIIKGGRFKSSAALSVTHLEAIAFFMAKRR